MSIASDLDAYEALLRKWNAVQNLVSRETLGELRTRHFADSLQLLPLLRPTDLRLIDLGSGGGFPAMPLAIASRGIERRFTLVEPIAKKAAFLRAVIRELALPAKVEAVRAEQLDSRETFDCVTSRALADLPQLLAHGARHLAPGGHMLLHKGQTYREEMSRAAALFDYDVVVHPSTTDPESAVLDISNLRTKSAA